MGVPNKISFALIANKNVSHEIIKSNYVVLGQYGGGEFNFAVSFPLANVAEYMWMVNGMALKYVDILCWTHVFKYKLYIN